MATDYEVEDFACDEFLANTINSRVSTRDLLFARKQVELLSERTNSNIRNIFYQKNELFIEFAKLFEQMRTMIYPLSNELSELGDKFQNLQETSIVDHHSIESSESAQRDQFPGQITNNFIPDFPMNRRLSTHSLRRCSQVSLLSIREVSERPKNEDLIEEDEEEQIERRNSTFDRLPTWLVDMADDLDVYLAQREFAEAVALVLRLNSFFALHSKQFEQSAFCIQFFDLRTKVNNKIRLLIVAIKEELRVSNQRPVQQSLSAARKAVQYLVSLGRTVTAAELFFSQRSALLNFQLKQQRVEGKLDVYVTKTATVFFNNCYETHRELRRCFRPQRQSVIQTPIEFEQSMNSSMIEGLDDDSALFSRVKSALERIEKPSLSATVEEKSLSDSSAPKKPPRSSLHKKKIEKNETKKIPPRPIESPPNPGRGSYRAFTSPPTSSLSSPRASMSGEHGLIYEGMANSLERQRRLTMLESCFVSWCERHLNEFIDGFCVHVFEPQVSKTLAAECVSILIQQCQELNSKIDLDLLFRIHIRLQAPVDRIIVDSLAKMTHAIEHRSRHDKWGTQNRINPEGINLFAEKMRDAGFTCINEYIFDRVRVSLTYNTTSFSLSYVKFLRDMIKLINAFNHRQVIDALLLTFRSQMKFVEQSFREHKNQNNIRRFIVRNADFLLRFVIGVANDIYFSTFMHDFHELLALRKEFGNFPVDRPIIALQSTPPTPDIEGIDLNASFRSADSSMSSFL